MLSVKQEERALRLGVMGVPDCIVDQFREACERGDVDANGKDALGRDAAMLVFDMYCDVLAKERRQRIPRQIVLERTNWRGVFLERVGGGGCRTSLYGGS